MAKIVSTKLSENNVAEGEIVAGKTDEEIKEIIETLQTQLLEYQTMTVKVQGALEVLYQMLPKEEISES
jgi:uncharacterized membrane-anchored protein